MKDKSINSCYRFRLISRGNVANTLTQIAINALQWCHPGIRITVIDANDEPQLIQADFPNVEFIHIIPGDDIIAKNVGRGTRKHLFYWRHSPMVLSRIPNDSEFQVYIDSDLVFIRPMDLFSVADLLRKGRIGLTVDESMLNYSSLIQERCSSLHPIINFPGSCGPLLQGGLIFTSSTDNGNFFEEFWKIATIAASENILDLLPFDDMTLLTLLLTKGGKFWNRWLPISPEWNYITAAGQDPGVFGVGAHYGGYNAKKFILENISKFTIDNNKRFVAWGSEASEYKGGRWYFNRGIFLGKQKGNYVFYELSTPFAITMNLKKSTSVVEFEIDTIRQFSCTLYFYSDGKYLSSLKCETANHINIKLNLNGGKTISIIAASDENPIKRKVLLKQLLKK